MKGKFVITLITLMLLSGVSHAGQAYISGFGGGTIVSDSDVTSSAAPGVEAQAEFDAGFNAENGVKSLLDYIFYFKH
jgi:hypothetical protein